VKEYCRSLIIIIFFSFFLIFPVFQAPGITQDKAAKIDELMNLYHEYGQFNGTVLVSEGGKVIYKRGIGLANVEWNIPNEPDTKFRLASITKQFAAMLIMQLVERGKIDLNGKITDYLPDYRKDTGDKVTIHHLLTHTSGIPNYEQEFWADKSRDPLTIEQMVADFCIGNLEFEPGSTHRYSNTGYYLLGVIIEKVTGKPLDQVLRENILEPTGMTNSGLDTDGLVLENRATGYTRNIDGLTEAAYMYIDNAYAAGGMYSTVEDLYLWDKALYTEKLLSKKYKKIMFKPFLNNYAYGWGIRKVQIGDTEDSTLTIGHDGGIMGFSTRILRLVEDKHLIAILSNTVGLGTASVRDITNNIISILYDVPYDLPRKSITEAILKRITEKGVKAGIEMYHEMKEKHTDVYDFRERELNTLGYMLLQRDKTEEAIEIFKLNIEVYPEYANGYDSLGEAYMTKGDRELAVINYAKSLELDPNNSNAVRILNRIFEE